MNSIEYYHNIVRSSYQCQSDGLDRSNLEKDKALLQLAIDWTPIILGFFKIIIICLQFDVVTRTRRTAVQCRRRPKDRLSAIKSPNVFGRLQIW